MSVDLVARCAALKAYARPERPAIDAGPPTGVVAAWAAAGGLAGMTIGAILGCLVIVYSELWRLAWIGFAVGGVIGAAFGTAIGAVNGVVLLALTATSILHPTAPSRRRRAMLAAAMTTAVTGLGILVVLFGLLLGTLSVHGVGYLFLSVPFAIGTITAAWLCSRLPPITD